MKALTTLALVLAGIAAAPSLAGQVLAGGATLQWYHVATSDDDVRLRSARLLTVPLSAAVPVRPWLSLNVNGAYADARVTVSSGARGTVNGLTDTQVQAIFGYRSLTLAAGALLPTGTVIQNSGDAAVVGVLSSDLLPFAVTQWGTGGGFQSDATYAFRAGEASVRLGLGATVLRGSSPLGSETVYEPGAQIRARLTLEAPRGEAGLFTVHVGYQRFAVDTYGGDNFYRPGGRLEALASYAFPLGAREGAMAYAGFYSAAGGRIEDGIAEDFPEAGFSDPAVVPSRKVIRLGGELHLDRGRHALIPQAEFRLLRREDGVGQGWLVSLMGRGDLRPPLDLAGGVVVSPTAGVRIGRSVVHEGATAMLVGWEAGAVVRLALGR